jgi:predicted metal-dependent HD superfamily phosphohydrolase
MMEANRQRWSGLWRSINAKSDPLPVYEDLVSLHAQPHRHYHNLRHISECLSEFDWLKQLARQPQAVELAIWFHDAVYDPRAADNEERSAGLAKRRIAEAGATRDLCSSVAALVMATKTHDPNSHPDAPLLVDVDLSILGKPPERFDEYETDIRAEYSWVPEATFAEKRAEILERFLARKRIYSTELVFENYEAPARKNLENSLRRLKT